MIGERRRPSRQELRAAIVLCAGYGAYAAWHWWYFRAFYPNTYVAKAPALEVGGAASQLLHLNAPGWMYVRQSLLEKYRFYWVAPLLVLPLAFPKRSPGVLLALILAGLLGLTILTGGDFYPEFRLGVIVLPVAFLLLAEGTRIAAARMRMTPAALVVASIPIALVCQPSVNATKKFADSISMGALKAFVNLELTVAREVGKPRLTVVESDIGAVAYFTGFRILDIAGLTNLHVARFGYYAPFLAQYIFEEEKPDLINLHGIWARNANVPRPLINRDYIKLDRDSDAVYAEGYYLRRDLYARMLKTNAGERLPSTRVGTPSEAIAAAYISLERGSHENVVEAFRRVDDLCSSGEAGCADAGALAARAFSLAERQRAAFHFAEAFDFYAAAFKANPRDVLALRRREDMRVARAEPAASIARRRFDELRSFYETLLHDGWQPATASDMDGLAHAVSRAGLSLPEPLLETLERLKSSADPLVRRAAVYLTRSDCAPKAAVRSRKAQNSSSSRACRSAPMSRSAGWRDWRASASTFVSRWR